MTFKEEDLVLISNCIDERKIGTLIEKCEEVEPMILAKGQTNIPPFLFQGFLLGYLIRGDLNNARFLWKRSPEFMRKSKEYQEIWQIGRYMWEKQYSQVYQKINTVSWSQKITPLLQLVAENFRRRTIRMLSVAYSSVSIEQFSNFVGYNKEQSKGFAERNGWEFDGQFIYPKPFQKLGGKKKVGGTDLIKNLTEKHLFLELNN